MMGAIEIWAARQHVGKPAIPGPASKELVQAQLAHLILA